MPKDQAMKFLNAVYTGKDKYDLFIKEKLIVEKSVWDTITKEKIPAFIFKKVSEYKGRKEIHVKILGGITFET